MRREDYLGHSSQFSGVEEHRLVGGKGDGMRLLEIRNGLGMEVTISLDRCADISRLYLDGKNLGYFSPCGYVHPAYYQEADSGFLKSFTAGFLTTCGLQNVGNPCTDEGKEYGLHGTIGNTPADHVSWKEEKDTIKVEAEIRQEGIFAPKLVMNRTIECSLQENKITLTDEIENRGDEESPCMILYHMNMGYPLLDEDATLSIPSRTVIPRNARARDGLSEWNRIIPPQKGFEEQCYYHLMEKEGVVKIYQPKIDTGVCVRYDPEKLPFFTQWKMMGKRDYVLGLEPGNCTADGRDVMRKDGCLKVLNPDEKVSYSIEISLYSK
ncbi:aldose 1-epimerase family protein [Blautia massiliensis (ex Durand et al. 2017)]|uniref:aldose 1-epimerase family protein n=1 Tax=Blautia massiliensis (ex Durand et al. 2017) TaxID=1737424 RepID=UPI0022E436F0|nr:aldose 1-epimerase family protein [Blautia massiliensis (ex Durand et al. 2017)]